MIMLQSCFQGLAAFALGLVLLCTTAWADAPSPIKALIIDGQNNHDWQATTPILKQILEETKRFEVSVATTAADNTADFAPDFSAYDVVISNYNGQDWPQATQAAFEQYVKSGGGFVVVHAANNAFPQWKAYNQMIGLGGWGGRNENSGPFVRFRDGAVVKDPTPGAGGNHGRQHPFIVVIRDTEHPIVDGLPVAWWHAKDELYDRLRGPAEGLKVLATAYSDPATGGSGEHEPILFTIDYGKGRVFHTPLGHSPESMSCVGFVTTLQRGTEWAATGKVTLTAVPEDFPTSEAVSVRKALVEGK